MSKFVLLDLPPVVSYPFIMENGRVKFILKSNPYVTPQQQHNMPNWMSPHLHIVLERAMMFYPSPVIATLFGLPYHILHGLICGYNMRQIIDFLKKYYWKSMRKSGFRVVTKPRGGE